MTYMSYDLVGSGIPAPDVPMPTNPQESARRTGRRTDESAR